MLYWWGFFRRRHMRIVDEIEIGDDDNRCFCVRTGSREQINKCLRLIRRKFPPSRFPELKLTPILPPPIASPRTAVSDSIIRVSRLLTTRQLWISLMVLLLFLVKFTSRCQVRSCGIEFGGRRSFLSPTTNTSGVSVVGSIGPVHGPSLQSTVCDSRPPETHRWCVLFFLFVLL